ncbi:MAG: hypothetical protein COY40_06880 [Alphaproteobacteria bacterium CG_4_10_14_0_8_um_filter_53_9]|nr:MAG: hypothetical protein COY40_06880 [Alphaproteobacteria bacterium CG_4_10_14_0_8_um_filter_53_9]
MWLLREKMTSQSKYSNQQGAHTCVSGKARPNVMAAVAIKLAINGIACLGKTASLPPPPTPAKCIHKYSETQKKRRKEAPLRLLSASYLKILRS